MDTPSQLSMGGRDVDSVYKCGRNATLSLSNIAQACGNVSGLRTKRHDNIVLHVAQMLKRRGIDVMMVSKFQAGRSVRKPDLVVVPSKELIVLDTVRLCCM